MSRDAQDHEATDGPSRPERRIDELGREAFQLAVTSATKAAAQEIARIHRVRLVTQAAFVSGLVTLAIAFAAAAILYGDQLSVARTNALYNCNLVRHLSAPLSDFVTTAAALHDKQPRPNVATLHFWRTSVVPRLDAIAADNCRSHVH